MIRTLALLLILCLAPLASATHIQTIRIRSVVAPVVVEDHCYGGAAIVQPVLSNRVFVQRVQAVHVAPVRVQRVFAVQRVQRVQVQRIERVRTVRTVERIRIR